MLRKCIRDLAYCCPSPIQRHELRDLCNADLRHVTMDNDAGLSGAQPTLPRWAIDEIAPLLAAACPILKVHMRAVTYASTRLHTALQIQHGVYGRGSDVCAFDFDVPVDGQD